MDAILNPTSWLNYSFDDSERSRRLSFPKNIKCSSYKTASGFPMTTLIWWECQWQRDHQIHITLHSVQFQPLGAGESWILNHSARKPFPFHQTNDCTWSHFILVWQFAVQHNFCNATRGQERMHLFELWLWLFPLTRILPLLVTSFNSQAFANKPTTLTLRAL